jgi:peptide chain release factor 1
VTGKDSHRIFAGESGGHRFQRVPPTEKRGRRQTSTVTVAVFPMAETQDQGFTKAELEWEQMQGSGPGGQHRQKTENCVRLRHLPTGITVMATSQRSLWQNKQSALRALAARLHAHYEGARHAREAADRKNQVGSGMRGDKVRTVRMQDGIVRDHRSGRKTSVARYLAGHLEDLA